MRSEFLRCSLASATLASLCLFVGSAFAQQGSGASSSNLPPVTVDAPEPRAAASGASKPTRRAAGSASRRGQGQAQTVAASSALPARETKNVRPGQDPRGPVNGYVADRSLTGTKTNTPLMETPQAISVVSREQIRDQNPGSFAEALRYAPGVRSETFGADTRNDWFKIRGFDAQDVGLFQDGLQLQSFAFATWKFPPFGIERIDILRGPSAVLYGGTGPGGLVNIVSKKPPYRSTTSKPASIRSATAICRSISADRPRHRPARARSCFIACSAPSRAATPRPRSPPTIATRSRHRSPTSPTSIQR
jgi:iron complex outermembrane receptor protein